MEALAPLVKAKKDVRLKKWKPRPGQGFDYAPLELVVSRVEIDVLVAWKLYEFFKEKILERGDPYPELLEKEMRWSLFLADLGWEGMGLDVDWATKLLQESRNAAYRLEKQYTEEWNPGFKIGSPAQVKKFFQGRWGISLPNTEDWVLGMAAKDKPEIKPHVDTILEYRRLSKIAATWLPVWLQSARRGVGSRVRGSWGLDASNERARASAFTRTLRLRCSKPNLQAVPVDDDAGRYRLRYAFMAREGNELAGLDFSQLEVRMAAHYAREERMLEILRDPEGDIHQTAADDLKLDRYRGKRLNLGAIYNIGSAHLAEEMTKELLEYVSERDTQKWLRKYRNRYPGFVRATALAERTIQERGYLFLWNGRRVHHNPAKDEPYKAFNLLIQTGVSELIKEGVFQVLDFFRDQGMKSRICLQVHDELILDMPQEEIQFLPDLARILEGIGPPGGWRCPLFVNTWHRERWGLAPEGEH